MKKSHKCILALAIGVTSSIVQGADDQLVGFNWGMSGRQGERPEMEDTHAAILNFDKSNEAFFGIFDGHLGKKAAVAIAQGGQEDGNYIAPLHEHIHERIASFKKQASSWGLDLTDPKSFEIYASVYAELYARAYEDMDKDLSEFISGSTAVTAHITQFNGVLQLILGWVGDSRAVLVYEDGKVSRRGTTVDHKPDNPEEYKRVKGAGGFITEATKDDVSRVGGHLAMSRALGDGILKQLPIGKGIIATPGLKTVQLEPHRHQLVILACDGVWDVLSNKDAAGIVQKALKETGPLPEDPAQKTQNVYGDIEETHEEGNDDCAKRAARALRDAAKKAGSTDNISALVVEFLWQ